MSEKQATTKGTKVFTPAREFEINDDYDDFRERVELARQRGDGVVEATMQDSAICFSLHAVIAFIPMIDLGF